MAQVELRDEHGNPVELTDAYGNPVWLTDEKGNPVHLTAVATNAHKSMLQNDTPQELPHSKSSSSSEDERHGERIRKGLKDNIEEKLPAGEGVVKENKHTTIAASTSTTDTSDANHHPTTEHEKKSIIDKIKEKFQ
ncbi:hypothetical protein AAZX31_12G225500 [Glycine max]|nr:hypothetical protein JHK87_034742 [Glycine soja]KAG4987173.1 hypothetical protein JHK86_034864 [Glycine max]KAG5120383.1 hypothetical protein JHK82_034803 [Glycine max]KAG5141356.1 hypothetical protein JHK84_035124 [Glycine max]